MAAVIEEEARRLVSESGLPAALRDRVLRGSGGVFAGVQRTRPVGVMPLVVYEAVGESPFRDAAPAGAAMLFLLAAGDLLDDLQDGDLEPGSVGGASGAAELMAALLALSSSALHSNGPAGNRAGRMARAHAFMSRLQLRALAGQGRDLELSDDAGATLDDALRVTVRKSGALGRCAAMMGAALATEDEHRIEVAGRFGELAATARQLLNDIAGVWPGGPATTDIALARKTPPVAFALAVDPASNAAAGRVRAALAQSPDERARADPRIRADIVLSGGIYYTWVQATVCGQRARRAAAELCPGRPDLDPSWIIGT